MSTLPPLFGLVLSGGASRRMGRDKALLERDGTPQLLRAHRLLQPLVQLAFVSVRADQRDEPLRASVPQIVDTLSDVGPVAGLHAAWQAHPDAAWLVLACDLPLLDAATLQALAAARAPTFDAIAFANDDGRAEPLCAIWEPSCRAAITARAAQAPALRSLLDGLRLRLLPAPAGDRLHNANTPQDAVRGGLSVDLCKGQ